VTADRCDMSFDHCESCGRTAELLLITLDQDSPFAVCHDCALIVEEVWCGSEICTECDTPNGDVA
jgi:ribosome-binding protein aMBF1 (putative translation factor)